LKDFHPEEIHWAVKGAIALVVHSKNTVSSDIDISGAEIISILSGPISRIDDGPRNSALHCTALHCTALLCTALHWRLRSLLERSN
jgi:hypothetical protein